MNSNKIPLREVLFIAAGETIVSAVICVVFLLVGKFDYKVLTGVLLGSAVTVLNFLFLCISVNRALDNCLQGFGSNAAGDMTATANTENAEAGEEVSAENGEEAADPYDDEAAKFAKENAGKLQNAVKLSYIVRTATVILALVLAFLTKQFNIIATVIPLLCLRPILSAVEIFRRKEKK